jgi:hypothetical protein
VGADSSHMVLAISSYVISYNTNSLLLEITCALVTLIYIHAPLLSKHLIDLEPL